MSAPQEAPIGYQHPVVPWNGLTVTDLFCGAGGSSSGLVDAGYKVVIAANHWQLAIESHQVNHPDTDHAQADISQVDPRYFPKTHVLWGSPECFTAGHLVTTLDRGQVPIEDIRIGELVMTHTGRFMPVVRVQHRQADTVIVKGQGHTGIETTPNHSFWARESGRVWQNDIRQYRREYVDAEWLRADELIEKEALWATPVVWRDHDEPFDPIPGIFGDTEAPYLLGRWLGDGSVSEGKSTDVTISCSNEESEYLGALLEPLGWHRDQKRTAVNFRIGNRAARDWLIRECGHGAGGKQVPTWAMLAPYDTRLSMLRGYLDADGGESQRRVRASTVSRKLAVSVRLLAESLGHRVAMAHDNRETYEIEGRSGVAKRQWIMHWEPELDEQRSPEAFFDGIHSWSRVRSVTPARENVTVYNIEVAEDHSYVLDGIVVKNCTNHSIAKGVKRQRQQDQALFELDGTRPLPDEAANRSRATMWDIPRFAEHHRYMAIILENVVDAYRWDQFPAWQMAMEALGYRMRFVWLNSMHAQIGGLPAPQSRDRMYIVMWREDLSTKAHPAPNVGKWTRPMALCVEHGEIQAVQAFKKSEQWGRYRAQYLYRCPECGRVVEPGWLPASSIIDWSLPAPRIGDRAKPLAEKTRERIRRGIERHWAPIIAKAAGNTYDGVNTGSNYLRVSELDAPAPVQTGTAEHGLALPPAFLAQFRERARTQTLDSALPTVVADGANHALIVNNLSGADESRSRPVSDALPSLVAGGNHASLLIPVEGREGKSAASTNDPMRTQSTRNETGLLVPAGGTWRDKAYAVSDPMAALTTREADGLVVPLRNHGVAKPATQPIDTVSAEGNHHALVMRNNNNRGDTAAMSTPVGEPIRALTTAGHQSLIEPSEPISLDVDDAGFRMLEPHEIQAGMGFARDYLLLGSKRDKVKQAGNAVTPPAARDLGYAVAEFLLAVAA